MHLSIVVDTRVSLASLLIGSFIALLVIEILVDNSFLLLPGKRQVFASEHFAIMLEKKINSGPNSKTC